MIYDNINLITKTLDFSGLNREGTIYISTNHLNDINDLKFTFYTRPSYILASGPQNLGGGENFHFYLNGNDITTGIKKCLIKRLKSLNKNDLKQQYLAGAKIYCDYVTTFDSYHDQYKDEYNVAKNFIEKIDIDQTFEQIGSRKVGISGNLHLVNFIYRFIDIQSLSMDEVLRENDQPIANNYKTEKNIILQISQGPSPTLTGFDPNKHIPAGSLEITLSLQTINPLEKPLKDIFGRLTQLQKQLESQRVTYLNPLHDITNKIDNDLQLSSERILTELSQIETNLKNL